MAIGNLFLGTGANKIGDVVLMRREGQQVSRVRVRQIANPRSQGQSEQRNYFAPVSKFYAPLAVVLEQSFEGLSKGRSYTAFLKRNINLARQQMFAAPKGAPFTPFPYQVSEGTLNPARLSVAEGGFMLSLDDDTVSTTLGALSSRIMDTYRIPSGAQVTIIKVDSVDGIYVPSYERFYLSAGSTEALPELMGGTGLVAATAAAVVIFSFFENNKWRRSTQFMVLNEATLAAVTGAANVAAAISSYGDGAAATPVSEVFLNGSNSVSNGSGVEISTEAGSVVRLVGIEQDETYYYGVTEDGAQYYITTLDDEAENFGKVMSPTGTGSAVNRPDAATRENTVAVPGIGGWSSSQAAAWSLFLLNEGLPIAVVERWQYNALG